MKIAIIGGGFYGIYFSIKLKEKFPDSEILIFEKNNDILKESAVNNQYRLHLGFHYPRSRKTIIQTYKGSKLFKKEFKKYLFFPKKNIYAIHKKSKISFKKYINVFKKLRISFKKLNKNEFNKFFLNPNVIQGAILTKEGVILLDKLYAFFKQKLKKFKIKILKKHMVHKIHNTTGQVFTKNKKYHFDIIFNTTFTNPNLGLNKKKFKIKYELSAMVYIKNFLDKDTCLTIMDGNFVSAYSLNDKLLSLSSVIYTPILKSSKLQNLYDKKINFKKIKDLIINDSKKYIKMPKKLKFNKITLSPKVKFLKDKNSLRTAEFVKEGRQYSILCGKLDAAPIIWKKIQKELS